MPHHSSGHRPRSSDPLVDASWAGRADLVAALLGQGSDPNQRDETGCSPLRAAVGGGHLEVMQALLAAGADPGEVFDDRTGSTLLSLTALSSRVEPMRLLLVAGADPNATRDEYYTTLMQAAGAQTNDPDENLEARVAMVRMLLDAGADVQAVAYRGMTPLGNSRGEDEIVRILLEAGATPRACRPGEDPLLLQVMDRKPHRPSREAGILRLLAAGAEVNVVDEYGRTPLKQACTLGSRRIVAALLESGARRVGATTGSLPGWDSPPELHLAATAGDPGVIRMLIHYGADPAEIDSAGRTPLYRAAVNGQTEAIRTLLDTGADPRAGCQRGRCPLRAAAYHGHEACASLLLEAGVDVNAARDGEVTALHLASLMRRVKVIPLLLQAGANPNARDADGGTPLMWALRTKAARERVLIKIRGSVERLLAAGADPRATDHRGQTALFDAARSGLSEEIRHLLSLGLDVNAAAHDGLAPLMAAAAEPAPETRSAEVLLAKGADANAVDRAGASALHHALRPLEPPDPLPLYWTPTRPWAAVRMIELLLGGGAEVNRADDHGLTPLMLAAQQGSYLVSPLLRAGADPEARDRSGRSARDYAEAAGRAWP